MRLQVQKEPLKYKSHNYSMIWYFDIVDVVLDDIFRELTPDNVWAEDNAGFSNVSIAFRKDRG